MDNLKHDFDNIPGSTIFVILSLLFFFFLLIAWFIKSTENKQKAK